jgi:hypothetical protein
MQQHACAGVRLRRSRRADTEDEHVEAPRKRQTAVERSSLASRAAPSSFLSDRRQVDRSTCECGGAGAGQP